MDLSGDSPAQMGTRLLTRSYAALSITPLGQILKIFGLYVKIKVGSVSVLCNVPRSLEVTVLMRVPQGRHPVRNAECLLLYVYSVDE